MISVAALRDIAARKLEAAYALFDTGHYDEAIYVCGYVVECALKACICDQLGEPEWPESPADFKAHPALKPSHNLNGLLAKSGKLSVVKSGSLVGAWSIVTRWEPGMRYHRTGSASCRQVEDMIDAAEAILGAL